MRVRIFGWVSAVHWNGHKFRVGETGDGAGDDVELTEEEMELREAAAGVASLEMANEFGDMIARVESVCKPRMAARNAELLERKNEKLRKAFEKAQTNAQ